jgi:hypothetical protein
MTSVHTMQQQFSGSAVIFATLEDITFFETIKSGIACE